MYDYDYGHTTRAHLYNTWYYNHVNIILKYRASVDDEMMIVTNFRTTLYFFYQILV